MGTGPIRRQRMPPPPKKASPPLSASPPESLESSRSASAATAATDHSEAVREAKRSGELKKLEFMRDSLKSAKQKVVLQNWQDQVNNMRQSKEASSQAREARIQNVMSHTQTHIKVRQPEKGPPAEIILQECVFSAFFCCLRSLLLFLIITYTILGEAQAEISPICCRNPPTKR